jgi:hypothetical protein
MVLVVVLVVVLVLDRSYVGFSNTYHLHRVRAALGGPRQATQRRILGITEPRFVVK